MTIPAIEADAPERAGSRQLETRLPGTSREYRWRVVGDPPPPPVPTRFQRFYAWLYEFNRY